MLILLYSGDCNVDNNSSHRSSFLPKISTQNIRIIWKCYILLRQLCPNKKTAKKKQQTNKKKTKQTDKQNKTNEKQTNKQNNDNNKQTNKQKQKPTNHNPYM